MDWFMSLKITFKWYRTPNKSILAKRLSLNKHHANKPVSKDTITLPEVTYAANFTATMVKHLTPCA